MISFTTTVLLSPYAFKENSYLSQLTLEEQKWDIKNFPIGLPSQVKLNLEGVVGYISGFQSYPICTLARFLL